MPKWTWKGMRRPYPFTSTHYRQGIAASLTAEVVFIGVVFLALLLRGMSPWMVLRLPAAFVMGPQAVRPAGFVLEDVLLGLLMHVLFAALIGVIYTALLPRLRLTALTGGVLTGAVLYGLGFWLLPQLFPGWLGPFWLPPRGRLLQAFAHVVYGFVLGTAFDRFVRRSRTA